MTEQDQIRECPHCHERSAFGQVHTPGDKFDDRDWYQITCMTCHAVGPRRQTVQEASDAFLVAVSTPVAVLEWEPMTRYGHSVMAVTGVGCYAAFENGNALVGGHTLREQSDDDFAAAKSACEQDYIARCTERMPLVTPGNVLVPRDLFVKLADSWCAMCSEEGLGDCRDFDCDISRIKCGELALEAGK